MNREASSGGTGWMFFLAECCAAVSSVPSLVLCRRLLPLVVVLGLVYGW